MKNDGIMSIGVKVTDAEILSKLEILRLERGISSNSFIIQAIAEKLRREGYLPDGVSDHVRKMSDKSDMDELLESLRKIDMVRK